MSLFEMERTCPQCKCPEDAPGKVWDDKIAGERLCQNVVHRPGAQEPRARTTDPATSHAAAKSVVLLTEKQTAVLFVFNTHGPLTDTDLLVKYREHGGLPQQSDSGLRTRRHELTEAGRLVAVGETTLPSGRRAITWDVPVG